MAGQTSTDPNVFILPDLGEGVHEAELISWKVSPGETVEEHQVVAEMETDKALVEVPSPRDGVIKELRGEVGEILFVGNIVWTYEGASDDAAPAPATAPTAEASPASEAEREDDGTVVGTMSGSLGAVTKSDGKALATPAVRRIARDMGIDIDSLTGSGIAGRVTEKDVRAASNGTVASAQPAPVTAPAPAKRLATTVPAQRITEAPRPSVLVPSGGDTTIIPVRGVRRTIANRLRQSVDMAVHFSVMDDADVTNLDKTRKQLASASGEKLSYLPFVVSAVCRAMKRFPSLNAHVDDENEQIIRSSRVHMGIATDTEQGLSVPVVPDADARGVLEIGREISALAQMTRNRSVPVERLKGSTFTISNVGSYAGRYATPILNYPEVGILATGRVRDGVIADNGAIRVAKIMPLSLTCDHRSVDGAEAAQCLALIIELLSRPEELLTPARG